MPPIIRVMVPSWPSSRKHFNISLKDIAIQDKPFNIFLVLNPLSAGFNPLFEFQHVLFYSEYGCFLNRSLMGNCVGKEYFRHHYIFCYIKREKITLAKEAIFPISQLYFLLLTMLLVRRPRDLCSTGGGSGA